QGLHDHRDQARRGGPTKSRRQAGASIRGRSAKDVCRDRRADVPGQARALEQVRQRWEPDDQVEPDDLSLLSEDRGHRAASYAGRGSAAGDTLTHYVGFSSLHPRTLAEDQTDIPAYLDLLISPTWPRQPYRLSLIQGPAARRPGLLKKAELA